MTFLSNDVDDHDVAPDTTWDLLETRRGWAFLLGGAGLLASAVVPIAFEPVTDLAWVPGLFLVGLAVSALAGGLLGLYPTVVDDAPMLSRAGVLFAIVAGLAVLGLFLTVGIGLGTAAGPADLMGPFAVVALSMAGGVAVAFLSFGIAVWRAGDPDRSVGTLLVAGGGVLLVPVVLELLHRSVGLATPSWVALPAVGLVAIDALATGYTLRAGSGAPRGRR